MSSKSLKYLAALLLTSAVALPALANANEVIYRYKSALVTVTDGSGTGGTGTGTGSSTGSGDTGSGGTGTGTGGSSGGTTTVSADPDAGSTSLACGSSADGSGPLGCTTSDDQSSQPAASQIFVTMDRPSDTLAATGDIYRCFVFTGGNGNFTVETDWWGSAEWLDHVEVLTVDLPQLYTEIPSYNLTASYPNDRNTPRRTTSGRAYCIVAKITKDAAQIEDPIQPTDELDGVITISDYDPKDMVGDRHTYDSNPSNYVNMSVKILGAEVLAHMGH